MKNNLYKYIQINAKNYPQKNALIFQDLKITYYELLKKIDSLELYLLKNLNIKPNDRITILSYNRLEFILLFYACAKIGSILVPLNWRLTNYEIEGIIKEIKPKAFFIESEFIKTSSNISLKYKNIKIIGIDFKPRSNLTINNLENINIKSKIHYKIKNNIQKPLLIVYTSGTTGKPKGAVITQKAIYYNTLNSIYMHQFNNTDIILTVIPLFHVGGLNIQTIPSLHIGATVILIKKFDIIETFKLLEKHKPTFTVFVPTIMEALIKSKSWKTSKLNSLKAITTGSTIVSPELIKTYEKKSIPIIQVYGSTETCPIAICQNILEKRVPIGNVGKTALHNKIKIFNKNNTGEIGIKGLNIFSYYWKNKEATINSFQNGWFMTGDYAKKNKNNQYFILGRKVDVIISGGENIYPAELEQVLTEEKNIHEAAVIGVPDNKWQEVPIAFIKLKNTSSFFSEKTLKNISLKLAKYKLPKKLIKIKLIPKNALGKIDYKILKEYYKNSTK